MIFDKPPTKVYLQYHGDSEPMEGEVDSDDVTWCWHRIFDSDIAYSIAPQQYTQVTVTDEMIEAGAYILRDEGWDFGLIGEVDLEAVFKAMAGASSDE